MFLAITALAAAGDPPVPSRCVFETPCVFVTPGAYVDSEPDGALITYRGRGWAPRGRIGAFYGSPCAPDGSCDLVGHLTSFHADAKGRFRFRLFVGAKVPTGTPGPAVAGSGPVTFGGPTPRGGHAGRDGKRPPPPSTPDQQAEAGRVAGVVRALPRAIGRARTRSIPASEAYEREIKRCRPLIDIERPAARAHIIDREVDAASEAGTYGADAPEFRAFADRLEGLHVTDPELAAGITAWTTAIRTPRHVPHPGLCAELAAWRDAGFPLDKPPIPKDATSFEADIRGDPAIRAAGLRLVDLGVHTATAEIFRGSILGLEHYIEF